jgi:hypothetical protein
MVGFCALCQTATRPGHTGTNAHRARLYPKTHKVARVQRRHVTDGQNEHFRAQVGDEYIARLAAVDDGAWVCDDRAAEYIGLGWHEPKIENLPLGVGGAQAPAKPRGVARSSARKPKTAARAAVGRHGENPEPCPKCGQEFRTPNGRAWHCANRHGG